jgi:molecular chaperone IbpA
MIKLAEKEKQMVINSALDLFKDPFFIGFGRELDRLSNVREAAIKQSFPPYDIIEHKEDEYMLSLAIAGFSKSDVDVSVKDGTLVIKGEKDEPNLDKDSSYLHKGIARRKFTRTFALGEYMEVTGADMTDGILNVAVSRVVPEEKKPKTIKIK